MVTSPPYLRVIRYGSYDWLRLWFLSHDPKQVDADTTPPAGTAAYGRSLRETLTSRREVLTDDAVVVLVLATWRRSAAGPSSRLKR
jgi:site-specific DNA-methyltransferase (adenine-specific)